MRRFIDDVRNDTAEFNTVLLVLEQFQFQCLLEPFVRAIIELLAIDGERTDVVHDLAAEVVFTAIGNVDLFFDAAHQSFVGFDVIAGVAIPHLLALRVRFDVVDVVPAEFRERFIVGRDGALHFVFDHVLVLLANDGEQLFVMAILVLVANQRVVS